MYRVKNSALTIKIMANNLTKTFTNLSLEKSASPKPIKLEGTTLEGGGQLLRIAIGLSSLTSIPVEITNIRGNRSGGGGLKSQHLTSVHWLGNMSKADMEGAALKSKDLWFAPRKFVRAF
jgi:RNA 3'-terminal phosphate cyclase (ATP)